MHATDGNADINGVDAIAIETSPSTSIYDYWAPRKWKILLSISVASVIVPFTDTIYLPALQAIQLDLNTNEALVAASVATYMFAVGIAALVCGPASDRFGRKPIYLYFSVAFLATSIVCIFAPGIAVLVAFRTLQGLAVAAYIAVGGGVVADVFPPEERGMASGFFMVPLLIGPIIGPLIGGGLAQAFGWRSTFICLTVFAAVVVVTLVVFVLPETHQYIILQRLRASDPALAASIREAEEIDRNPPVFHAPWVPLKYLVEADIAPYAIVTIITFGAFFASLTEFPIAMAAPPYSLAVGLIGVAYLPQGIGGFLAAPLVGKLSDHAASAHPDEPESRLVYSTIAAVAVQPLALLLYAWSLEYKVHIVAPLIAQFFIGAGCAAWMPGVMGYLSSIKQSAAGAAIASVQLCMFESAGALILISSVAVQAIGFGPFFTIMAGLQFLASGYALVLITRKRRASHMRQRASQVELMEGQDKE